LALPKNQHSPARGIWKIQIANFWSPTLKLIPILTGHRLKPEDLLTREYLRANVQLNGKHSILQIPITFAAAPSGGIHVESNFWH
jgi:hypothetical protein